MKKYILINLNKAESRETRFERWKERGRWAVFTVIAVLLVYMNAMLVTINHGYNRMIADKKIQIEKVRQDIELLRHKGKNLSKKDILELAELEDDRILWARNLELLGEMTPEDMALTGLKFFRNRFIIQGIALVYRDRKDFDIINSYVNRLRSNTEFSREFERIRFSSFTRDDFRGQEIIVFEIEASLAHISQSEKESSNDRKRVGG